jgi:hypothetical protein
MVRLDILQYMLTRYEEDGDRSFYSVRKLSDAIPQYTQRAIQKGVKELHSQVYLNLNADEYIKSVLRGSPCIRTYQLNLGRLRKIKNLIKEHIEFKLRVAETRRLLDSNRAITALKS